MIIQTGMRTDIPAFYSQWLQNRIKEGYDYDLCTKAAECIFIRNKENTNNRKQLNWKGHHNMRALYNKGSKTAKSSVCH